MGYAGQNLLTDGDQKFVSSQFVKVGDNEGEISIQELTPPADWIETAADAGLSLSELGGGGETVGWFVWTFCEDAEKFGWMDMMSGNYEYATATIDPGEGTWVLNEGEDATVLTIDPPASIQALAN